MTHPDKHEMAVRAEQRAASLKAIRGGYDFVDQHVAGVDTIAERLRAGVGPIGAEPEPEE